MRFNYRGDFFFFFDEIGMTYWLKDIVSKSLGLFISSKNNNRFLVRVEFKFLKLR